MEIRRWSGVLMSLLVVLVTAVPAGAADEAVIGEVLQILKERGLVDEGRYNELVLKNARYEEEHQSLLGRIEWSGDLRARFENFWFDEDDLGNDVRNRNRLRYRLRLQGIATINDWLKAGFRIASGELLNFDEGANRSANRTLGRDNDFGFDTVFIDRAYIEMSPPEGVLPGGSGLTARFGKVPNPFRWKNGRDQMLWDSDINPEGVSFEWSQETGGAFSFFANGGYFIIDENSSSNDPHVLGLQGGVAYRPGENVEIGGRISGYAFRSLNNGFVLRARAFGATQDLTDDEIHAGEFTAYVRYDGFEDWPVLIYGQVARNFSAEDVLDDAQDTGWTVGVDVGDAKKVALLGLGYHEVEANFWPSQFIDSNLTDGFTNRKGWFVYGQRQILPSTELKVTLFWSDDLETQLPLYTVSTGGADRVRLQTDLIVKF